MSNVIAIKIEIGNQKLRNMKLILQFVEAILENAETKEKSNGNNNQNETNAEHTNLTRTATHLVNFNINGDRITDY